MWIMTIYETLRMDRNPAVNSARSSRIYRGREKREEGEKRLSKKRKAIVNQQGQVIP